MPGAASGHFFLRNQHHKTLCTHARGSTFDRTQYDRSQNTAPRRPETERFELTCEIAEPDVKAVVRDLGKTKNGKQKAAKEARKIVEMKGKQIKDELSLAMIQLFTKLLDEDSVEASTIDDVIQGPN